MKRQNIYIHPKKCENIKKYSRIIKSIFCKKSLNFEWVADFLQTKLFMKLIFISTFFTGKASKLFTRKVKILKNRDAFYFTFSLLKISSRVSPF